MHYFANTQFVTEVKTNWTNSNFLYKCFFFKRYYVHHNISPQKHFEQNSIDHLESTKKSKDYSGVQCSKNLWLCFRRISIYPDKP